MLLYLLIFNFILDFNKILTKKSKVYIHLEKFNEKLNLMHTGISFKKFNKNIRYDYRAFNDGNSYLTNNININNFTFLFPGLTKYVKIDDNDYKLYRSQIKKTKKYSKNIYFGETNKTFDEIIDFEKKYLSKRKYFIGFFDCRHYVNDFTKWSLNKKIPIWNLKKLWNNNN